MLYFPTNSNICSLHFEEKHIIIKNKYHRLSPYAFPCRNLPTKSFTNKDVDKQRGERLQARTKNNIR